MIVLDTNIISELMRPKPEPRVEAWLNQQAARSIWTTSICVFELYAGLAVLPNGKRRRSLEQSLEVVLTDALRGRVLPLDVAASKTAAEILQTCTAGGTPLDLRDLLIAGITANQRATLATRNIKHFANTGVALIDPWNL